MENLKAIAEQLSNSSDYRVIRKYAKPKQYNVNRDSDKKLVGVFLDVETTGLSHTTDKLIELGMVKFEYCEAGKIFDLLDEFNEYQDPGIRIPEHITKLTGITDEMVKNCFIDSEKVARYLDNVDIIIAHNATFDRAFFETTFSNIKPKPWACSMKDIDWENEGITGRKLDYIAYKYGFFYEGHRAIIDCLAGIHILAQNLLTSQEPVLKRLLDNAAKLEFKIWAKDAPYGYSEHFKSRNYLYRVHPIHNFKAWCIDKEQHEVQEEIEFLKSKIQLNQSGIVIDKIDALNRYSVCNFNQ